MTITAKFPGKCSKCGGSIEAGEKVEWVKGAGVSHPESDSDCAAHAWIMTATTDELVRCEAAYHAVIDTGKLDGASADETERVVRRAEQLKAEIQRRSDEQHAPAPEQQPERPSEPSVVSPGVFEQGDAIYLVTKTKDGERLYAKQLREFKLNVPRVLEDGTAVEYDCEWEYVRGVVFDLSESDRMDIDRAKALSIRYGRCLKCGRQLKARESVEAGIGPVCRKSFGGAFITA